MNYQNEMAIVYDPHDLFVTFMCEINVVVLTNDGMSLCVA